MSETPDVTPVNEWTVPNQDKLEPVIDARLAKLNESSTSETAEEPAPKEDEVTEQTEESDS